MSDLKIRNCINIVPNKIDKIFHLADIHLRLYKRQDEYRLVFENLYKDLKSRATKNSIIFIAGDLFHSKNILSPELIFYGREFLDKLSSIATTVIIPGNHDLSLSNMSRMDAITPIVKSLENRNIIYSNETEILEFDNLVIAHTAMYESKPISSTSLPENKLKFGTYHGRFNGAKNQYGFEFESTGFTKDGFYGYDAVMLGDIHKQQNFENIVYASSLIQQDQGEDLTEHGYVEWIISGNEIKYKFIRVKNPHGYITIVIDENGIHEPEQIPEIPTIRFIARNISTGEFNKYLIKYKKNKQIKGFSIVKEGTSKIGSIGMSLTNNISNIDYQNTLLKDYLKEQYNLEDTKIEKIYKINEHYNNNIVKKDDQIGMRWTPIKLEFDNMFAYGEGNVVDFSTLNGVIGLFGSNFSGKSSTIDCLLYCIYEKCGRPTTRKINILNTRKENFRCLFEFDFAGERHFIERTGEKTGAGISSTLNFWKIKNDEKINLNGKDIPETNTEIRKIFGRYDDIITTAFSLQDNKAGFIFQKQAERKTTWSEMLRIAIFNDLYTAANKDLNVYKTSVKVREEQIDNVNMEDLNKEKQSLNESLSDIEGQVNLEQSKLSSLQIQLSSLKGKIIPIDETIRSLEEIEKDILKKKNEAEENIKNKNKQKDDKKQLTETEIEKINTSILEYNKEIIDINKKLEEISNENKNILNEISTIDINLNKFDIENINTNYDKFIEVDEKRKFLKIEYDNKCKSVETKKKTVKTLLELEYDKDCKYCMSNPFTKQAIETKNTLNNDILELESLKAEYDKIDKSYNELLYIIKDKSDIDSLIKLKEETINKKTKSDNMIAELNLQLSTIKNNIDRSNINKQLLSQACNNALETIEIEINKIIENSKKELLLLSEEITKYHKNIKIIEDNKNTNNDIEITTERILDQEKKVKIVNDNKISISQAKAIVESKITNLNNDIIEINKLYDKIELYDFYVSSVHKNGLPLKLITDTIPLLEQVTNDILSLLVDFTARIELEDKNINAYIVKSERGEWPVELASGFESFVLGLATRIAISKITNLNISNFMIIDEGWGKFDDEHISSANGLIQYLNSEYDFTLLVTHVDVIKGMVNDYHTVFVDEDGFSHINIE